MFNLQRRYIKLALAAIYIAYCGVTTFCIHTHIVDGVTYVHHHPDKSRDHNSNIAEIIFFNAQSSVENVTIAELAIAHYFELTEKINTCRPRSIAQQKNAGCYYLRPPPVLVSLLG